MEALEIIMPTLQERFDKITASVSHLDPRVGGPWPKLQTLKEYMLVVADPQKPRCQKCGVNLLWAQSVICVGCGTKTELGLQSPPEIDFTLSLAFNRYVDGLLATGKLKDEGPDKLEGGQWVIGDGPDSRRGSASVGSSESRRGSGSGAAQSGAESRRGSGALGSLDNTSQRGQPSLSSETLTGRSSLTASPQVSGGRSGSVTGSDVQFSKKSSFPAQQGGQPPPVGQAPSSSQPVLPKRLSEPSSGSTGQLDSFNSRLSDDDFFPSPTSTSGAGLPTGLGDFREGDQYQSVASKTTAGVGDFTGFDSGDFFAKQPDSSGASATSGGVDSVRSKGNTSAEGNLFINQLEGLDLSQTAPATRPPLSNEASSVVGTLLSEMHDLSFMLANHLVIPSEDKRVGSYGIA